MFDIYQRRGRKGWLQAIEDIFDLKADNEVLLMNTRATQIST